MKNFIRYWNQNRKKIMIIIAIIVFVFIIIKTLDNIFLNNSNKNNITDEAQKYEPTQSVITGTKVTTEKTKENTDVIEKFVTYCNNAEYENAYNLLTDDCKEEFNNNINIFIQNYVSKIFKNSKTYDLDLWLTEGNIYTYQIELYDDNLLATGGSSINSNIQDYITVVSQNNENKININGFIQKKNINKSQEVNGINIVINSKKVYKNYETYNITIKNQTDKTIMLTTKQNSKDICLVDNNNIEYTSFLNEIPETSVTLKSGYEKSINIRFNKIYDLYRTIEKVKFKSIILDYEKYLQNSNESIEKIEMEISIK